MNQDAVRVGLVGTGGVCAGVHYPGLRLIPGVEIAGICEPDETLRQERQAEWGIAAAFDRLDALLDAVAPDAVCIAVPNVYHYELIVQALDANCHVLCEKPLGMDFAQTREIYARGKASGRRHMTAFTYRFVPAMNYIRHLVQTGALGAIRHARFQRLQDWGECAIGWRQYKRYAGSGELGDMGIHRIDFAEDLLGPIEAVCSAPSSWCREIGPAKASRAHRRTWKIGSRGSPSLPAAPRASLRWAS